MPRATILMASVLALVLSNLPSMSAKADEALYDAYREALAKFNWTIASAVNPQLVI